MQRYKKNEKKDMTEHLFENIKKIFAFVFGFVNSVLFYFMPIKSLVGLLFILFIVSYLIGVLHSIRNQFESISKTKTFKAVTEFTVYTLLIAGFFVIGNEMKANTMMLNFIEIITWGLIYIYTTNIFKNLNRLMPYARGIRWIYYVLNLEFIKKIPILADFEKQEKENEKRNNRSN